MLADLIRPTQPARFHTHEGSRPALVRAIRDAADLADFQVIGRSERGVPIWAVTLGRGPRRVALAAGAHADEPVGPATLRHLIVAGLAPPHRPNRLADLLDRFTFHIIPHVNPDAEVINFRGWIERWPSPAAYIASALREPPGRDVEFGYPDMRPENQCVADHWRRVGPVDLYVNLHGMSFAEGGMLLIERHWTNRSEITALREGFTAALRQVGLGLHDHDRRGEKGFLHLGPGFTTTPEGRAMQQHFKSIGQPQMASLFHLSSMEFIRSLGGDPLCLVTELPLFNITRAEGSTPGRPAAYLRLRELLPALRLKASRHESIDADLEPFGIQPLDLATAIHLQLRTIDLGLTAIS